MRPTTALTTHEFETHLPYPAADVWDWHIRPGAVVRLTPGFARMRVRSEASNLRDGTTTFDLPGGLSWVARHDPAGFAQGRSFADTCVNQPFRLTGWHHEHLISDGGDGTSTVTDRIASRVPGSMLARIASYRRRQLTDDLAHLAEFRELDAPSLTIAVSGASGLVGTQLVALLRTAGHTVIPLVRSTGGEANTAEAARYWDPASPAPDLLDGVDAVVHLAGAPIFGRFTAVHKAAVRDSRVGPTRRLAEVAASCGVKVFDLRIACTMMEAWLMADPRGFSDFFHFRVGKIPQDPDSLDRAKQSLLSLVKRFGKGPIQDDVVTNDGQTGPLYTHRLNEFARDHWNVEAATENSPSLERAVRRLGELRAD